MTPTGTPDLLPAIVAAARRTAELRAEREPLDGLVARVAQLPPPRGRFRTAISRPERRNVIAECKRRSPSRGVLRAQYDPVGIAQGYERAGASAISVLTEPTFFDGALEHLRAVRASVAVPVLRKDFIVVEYQLFEARLAGADAVLLIVAALSDRELRALAGRAAELGLDALVEVHDERELDRALEAGAAIVGVNNRNLRTLDVDLGASERLARRIPTDIVAVCESGLRTGLDLDRFAAIGYRAFLVGEQLMTAADPGAALGMLLAADAAGAEKTGS